MGSMTFSSMAHARNHHASFDAAILISFDADDGTRNETRKMTEAV
jgi:hypothetical protein